MIRSIGLLKDKPEAAEAMERELEKAGYRCVVFSTGEELRRFLGQTDVDLLILGWVMAGESSLDLIYALKILRPDLPLMMLTDHSDPADIIAAFQAGADEYVLKPVRIEDLLVSIRTLERRIAAQPPARTVEVYGKYRFDLYYQKLSIDGRKVRLTPKEFALALLLFKNHGHLVTREYLRDMIWGHHLSKGQRTLNVLVSKVKAKAMLTPENGCTLHSFYSVGYRLDLDLEASPQ